MLATKEERSGETEMGPREKYAQVDRMRPWCVYYSAHGRPFLLRGPGVGERPGVSCNVQRRGGGRARVGRVWFSQERKGEVVNRATEEAPRGAGGQRRE